MKYFLLAIAMAVNTASAQNYPAKPVRIIVPNAPSGLADVSARIVAAKLSESLGQQFIVENRVGAGSTLGTAAAVKAAPDGYTLLAVFDSHATNPHLFKNLEYNTITDLTPIALLVRGPLVLVVNPAVPVKTVTELVALAKAKPGALNFASVGPGSPARLLMELLKLEAGVNVTNVPYKGAGGAITDLIAGHVDAMFPTVSTAAPHVRSGRLRAIAVTSEKPSAALPGVPVMMRVYPNFRAESWVGLLAPAKLPSEIVTRLNAECSKLLAQSDVKSRFAELGLETAGGSPAQFDQWIKSEIERWGRVIRAQKISLE
ncbi:MAG TPA: tripartite tricarboxylate transporter substrate binding protein [Burkholderiales bacterium]|nr:tripartite tricarboxylate transporter substrate binding protein [Burkholderiales bacterium]